MRLLILLTTTLAIFNCSQTKKTDVVFKQIVFDDTTSTNRLRPVEKDLLKKWGYDGEYASYRDYYYYLDLEGKFHPKVIKITGDDYSALLLLTFDENGNTIDKYEIAGGGCGGPTELDDKIEFCPQLKSIMTSETEFTVREIHEFTTDTVNWVATERDSIEWKVFINDNGKIIKKE